MVEDFIDSKRSIEPGYPLVEMPLQKRMLIVFRLRHSVSTDALSRPEVQICVNDKIFEEELLAGEQAKRRDNNRVMRNTSVLLERSVSKQDRMVRNQSGSYELLQSLKKELRALETQKPIIICKASKSNITIQMLKVP